MEPLKQSVLLIDGATKTVKYEKKKAGFLVLWCQLIYFGMGKVIGKRFWKVGRGFNNMDKDF